MKGLESGNNQPLSYVINKRDPTGRISRKWRCLDLSWCYTFLWSSLSGHPFGVFEQDSGILFGVLADWQTFICLSWTWSILHRMLIACPLSYSSLFGHVVQAGSFPFGSKVLNVVFLLLHITFLLDHLWALLVQDLLVLRNYLDLLLGRARGFAAPLAQRAITVSATALQLGLLSCRLCCPLLGCSYMTQWASALIWKTHPKQSKEFSTGLGAWTSSVLRLVQRVWGLKKR